MPKSAVAWLGFALSAGGLALITLSPIAAVCVAFAGFLVAGFSIPAVINTPSVRLAFYLATTLNAGAVWLASGSPWLAGVVLAVGLTGVSNQVVLRNWSSFDPFQPMVGAVVAAGLLAAAWPVGGWIWAVVPHLVLGSMFVAMKLAAFTEYRRFNLFGSPLRLGAPMPPVRLPRRDGSGDFELLEQRRGYVLLCFVRGDWCPMCQIMMRIYRKEAARLADLGVTLVVVSPSHGPEAEEFARTMGLDYVLLVDRKARLARDWGLLQGQKFRGEDVPLPVSLLISPAGDLLYVSKPEDFSSFADDTRVLRLLQAEATA